MHLAHTAVLASCHMVHTYITLAEQQHCTRSVHVSMSCALPVISVVPHSLVDRISPVESATPTPLKMVSSSDTTPEDLSATLSKLTLIDEPTPESKFETRLREGAPRGYDYDVKSALSSAPISSAVRMRHESAHDSDETISN